MHEQCTNLKHPVSTGVKVSLLVALLAFLSHAPTINVSRTLSDSSTQCGVDFNV